MSCHDWQRLTAHRFDPSLEPPPEWESLTRHLADCDACRREAVACDPLLVFAGASAWEPDSAETVAVRQAVESVRRADQLSRRSLEAAPRRRRFAAAAALFIGTFLLLPATTSHEDRPEPGARRMLTGSAAPAIDGLDRPFARVYEWGAEDLSVVMVVDESLDV